MTELKVSIEINGVMTTAGILSGNGARDAVFRYDDSYMDSSGAGPVSISLPFQREAFSSEKTKSFFEGLLPEGFTRRAVAQWMRTPENDYLTILHGLGRECLGAIRITDEADTDEAEYEELSLTDVKRLAGEGAGRSAEIVVQSHLSLTGASGKVGLYYDAGNDKWYLPRGTAPSTHIVKQSHVRLNGIVLNEQLALRTAKHCGIDTADTFIINTGHGRDSEILLASARFDRSFSGTDRTVRGLKVPYRLHQEDFAQALGIPSDSKYENPGESHMKKAFELLRKYSDNPIRDQQKLWDIIVFNTLIGNTDGHLKNLSLLYSPDIAAARLAPAYDIVSTAVYSSCTRNLAFSIGGASSLDSITADSFRKAAEDAGMGAAQAVKSVERLCNSFESALSLAADELKEMEFPGIEELKDGILEAGAFRNLS